MATRTHASNGASSLRSTLVVIAVAGLSFIGGALTSNALPARDVSASFAPAARAAEPGFAPASPAGGDFGTFARGFDAPRGATTPQPRECDLQNGISSDCLWLD